MYQIYPSSCTESVKSLGSHTRNFAGEPHFLWTTDVIRLEYPSAEVVKTVAALVSSKFEDYPHSTILYHLDSQNLAKFKANEIANIYNY